MKENCATQRPSENSMRGAFDKLVCDTVCDLDMHAGEEVAEKESVVPLLGDLETRDRRTIGN